MDAEGIELLEPSSVRSRSVRVANPLRRTQPSPSHTEGERDDSRRLRVVYDCRFDRFFLREDALPERASSPVQQLSGVGDRPKANARASQCVQWEDLLLPPRSASKRNTIPPDAQAISGSLPGPDKSPELLVSGAGHVPLDQPGPNLVTATTTPVEANVGVLLVATGDSTGLPTNQDAFQTQKPVETQVVGATLSESTPAPSKVLEEQLPVSEESTVSPSLHDASSPVLSTPSTELVRSPLEVTPTKLEAAVVLLHSLLRFVRRRRGSSGDSAIAEATTKPETQVAPAIDLAATAATEAGNSHCQPVVSSQTKDVPVATPQTPTSLRLDLTAITSQDATATNTISPSRQSPQKKTRIANYQTHFAAAATPSKSNQVVEVDDADAHEIRWQGEVVRVGVEIPKLECGNQLRGQDHRQRRFWQNQPITHIYNLKDLMRIRPTGDGFRRVNESCRFAELTSSSESDSESEEEVAPPQIMSSDDAEDPQCVFKRGDRVLFYGRHRWFKGTILRRIKVSWFYDIRADNGTVFEAIQTRRIRPFAGEDGELKVREYDVGDRVLWRPQSTSNSQGMEKRQTYKARIKRVRQKNRVKGRLYDLELRTGRIVKNVPSELLCLL